MNIVFLQTVSISLETEYGTVNRFNIQFDNGSGGRFILNSALKKLDVSFVDIENLAYGSFGKDHVV